jgi:ABC-type multidrug transport system fused ATPase/permease subunit
LNFVGKESTLRYISRSIENLEMFDKIYFFENGKIIEAGNWKELIERRGKFYKIVKEI